MRGKKKMTAAANARELIGDIRYTLATYLRDEYPRPDGANGFSHTAESNLVKGLCGVDLGGLKADYYIAPGDGAGPIIVEVGNQNDKKWLGLTAKDGQPVRTLHVGLDRRMHLGHPRHTQFERDMLRVLGAVCAEDKDGDA